VFSSVFHHKYNVIFEHYLNLLQGGVFFGTMGHASQDFISFTVFEPIFFKRINGIQKKCILSMWVNLRGGIAFFRNSSLAISRSCSIFNHPFLRYRMILVNIAMSIPKAIIEIANAIHNAYITFYNYSNPMEREEELH
jgi:hypothetical protein